MEQLSEKLLKKMGEVLAFAKFGDDTMKNGHDALSKVLGVEFMDGFFKKNDSHIEDLYKIANSHPQGESIMCEKSEKTFDKFIKMRDIYLHDEWDDAIEIMEWLGFFEGAAVVHWSLVEGKATQIEHPQLMQLSTYAKDFHRDLLSQIETVIAQ